ncbi:MAG: hypothetical protein IKO01_02960 [Kiritimatiellae bacterium]|nr:hypothetical protein [Kiritimatiellia bacterium]
MNSFGSSGNSGRFAKWCGGDHVVGRALRASRSNAWNGSLGELAPPPRLPTSKTTRFAPGNSVFQWLEKSFPMVGKMGPVFPMIGKKVSNGWKILPCFSNDWKKIPAVFQ